ncbi:MAG TPA: hypothetical protein VH092_09015 [Urbifossiella sp.]|jgi:hypothetical protein|nr:hypothetical protein [Urbifossiella sp.]
MKPLVYIVVGALVTAAAVAGNVPPPPPMPAAPRPAMWEYRVHQSVPDANEFNRLGADGWELATSYAAPNAAPVHTFKRPKR